MTTISTTPASATPAPATPSARPFGTWLKYGAVTLTTFVVCWTLVVGYWNATGRNPGTGELALALLALPAALLLGVWGARKLAIAKEASSAVATPRAAMLPAVAGVIDASTPLLAIIATAVRSPYGASTEELADAIANNEARADLDKELVDDHGFPVMAARSEDAHDEALQDEIVEWLSGQGIPHLHLDEEQWRALILASGVAAELASRATDLLPPEGKPPVLQLKLILPGDWSLEVRSAATSWLRHVVGQYGWPAAAMTTTDVSEQDGPASPTAVLLQLMPRMEGNPAPLVAVVIACASQIGQESVDRLAAQSLLFTSADHANGQVPGEGAAGLLLSDLQRAQSVDDGNLALLGPVLERRLASSADDARRADATLLTEMTQQIGKSASIETSQIDMIVADTAHRVSRVLELMALASPVIEQVDAADDIVRIGLGSGSCGAVPFMTVLALAQHYTCARQAPVLCISNEDPYLRCAALVRPMH